MLMSYCPVCERFSILKNDEGNPYLQERTIMNMMEDSVVPLQHYRCICGNYLAGYLELITGNDVANGGDEAYDGFMRLGERQKEDNICYFQDQVLMFNRGGAMYDRNIVSKNHQFKNLSEFAQWCYEDRKQKEQDGTLDESMVFNPIKASVE